MKIYYLLQTGLQVQVLLQVAMPVWRNKNSFAYYAFKHF